MRRFSWKDSIVFVSLTAVFAIAGCRTHSAVKAETEKTDSSFKLSAPIGGTYCLQTLAQGPALAKAVHFSYKEAHTDGSLKNFEGDLLGDTLDSSIDEKHLATDVDREMAQDKRFPGPSIVDGFVETKRSNHYTRGDASGWSMGSTAAVQGFTPWGLFIAKPEVKQVGTENIAGFDTIKFSVDTSQQSQLDKMPMTMAGGLKDYTIRGNAWLDKKQQCIVQYSIDYEEDQKDGAVNKTHYEGNTAQR
jgi:hypothetical protein